MGRRNDQPPAAEMRPHQLGQPFLARRIEGGGGLVEQPDRARRRHQAGDGEPPALAGRQVGGRQAGEAVQGDGFEGREGGCNRCIVAAQIRIPELEVLQHRQGRFEGVAMAEIVGLLGERRLRRATAQLQPAMGRLQQPGDQPQQGGLPGAISAGDRQRLAAADGKIDPLEHLAPAPHAAKIVGRQADHHDPPPALACKRAPERRPGASVSMFVRAMFATQVDVAEAGKSPYKRAY
jgi:hypothetical protein